MAKKRIGDNPLDSLIPRPESQDQTERELEGPNDSKTANLNDSKTLNQQEPTSAPEKVKVTYYLEPDDEVLMERAWLELRRLSGRKVSKSELVGAALRRAAEDLKTRGASSWIAKALEQ